MFNRIATPPRLSASERAKTTLRQDALGREGRGEGAAGTRRPADGAKRPAPGGEPVGG